MVTKMLLVDSANYVMLRGSKYIGISTNSVATCDQISARGKSSCRVAEPHCHFHVLFQLWSLWSFTYGTL